MSARKPETVFSHPILPSTAQCRVALCLCRRPFLILYRTLTSGAPTLIQYLPSDLPSISFASPDQGTDRPETCRAGPPIYGGNRELLSPRLVALGSGMGLGMEGELVSPLLMAPVHIDPSCLHPDLLTEVQHVVIAREQLLLHLNQVIGRGQSQFHNCQNSRNDFTFLRLPCPKSCRCSEKEHLSLQFS